ncbi:MAG: terminase family protein [Anaerolineae bacterium]|nr:terminase family protein [Anaerolineae bacterium]
MMILETAARGGDCWWLSPTYKMAGQVWRDLRRSVRGLPGIQVSEVDRRLETDKGGAITIRSAHAPDYLRGAGLDFAVLDEAAFMPPELWPEVVRPMLLDKRGGALFLSTPWGHNWFYDLYRLGRDKSQPDWGAFHYTTYDNPLLDRAEIDEIRRATPDRIFRAEYLAEFLDDAGEVFRGIHDAATAPLAASPQPGRIYVAGVDWGRSRDYTAIVIMDVEARQMVALDRFHHIGWDLQRGRLKSLCAIWNPRAIWAEENSIGAVNIEALQSDGLPVRPFRMTAASKGPLIEALALAIERRDLALLPDETLLGELAAYGMVRLSGGGLRYSAPPGQHDDTVIALALAWHAARHGGALGVDFL